MSYHRKHQHPRRQSQGTRRRAPSQTGASSFTPLFLVGFVFLLGFFYVGVINHVATGELTVRQLERKILEMKTANQELEIRTAALRSLETVAERTDALHLVAQASVAYTLPAEVSAVALSK